MSEKDCNLKIKVPVTGDKGHMIAFADSDCDLKPSLWFSENSSTCSPLCLQTHPQHIKKTEQTNGLPVWIAQCPGVGLF